uniref:Uncharacterized protein MANES_04G115600 n=1 Tax=Rhizophora mucronata TaxID=61149 RepID=A0A2P2LWZ7_RHIMU
MGIALSIDIGGFIFGCWDRCFKRATSLSQLENNLGNLQNKRDRLKARSDDTLDRVRIEEAEPLHEVAAWWKEVDDAIAKADNLLSTRQQEIEKLCLGGCCSKNCVSSIIFQRKVIESLQQVDELCGRNLGAIVQPRPVVVQAKIPLDEPVGLETTFDKAWRCLVEENIGILGLWGMGGVGKTTLVKQIYNKFCATGLVPIWAVVSKDYNLDKVQEVIGEQLGLCQDEQWKKQAPERKATRISNKLRNNKFCKNKFVLILDDIWDYIDLTEVGVPTEQSESKIIFTTRSESVCGKMNAKAIIKVEPLTQQEAWKLFTKNIQKDILKIPGICPLAEAVARECDGLPLALVTISKTTSPMKTLQEWTHALEVLTKATSKFADMERKVFSRLKFSYDSLPDDKVKSCFLYCSLFPEDYKIEKDLLIDYLICEKLIEGENYEIDLRNKGYFDIGNLVRVGLLEEEEERGVDFVRMHDLIRDMALWIAKDKFFVKSGMQLNKVPSVEQWQGAKRVSLMKNRIEKIEEVPECRDLSTLFLNGNRRVSIHDDFFQSMNALTVLDLSCTWLQELPSGITKLVSLQSLNLSGTTIRELPLELNELEELKCLNIERTRALSKIPRNLLSSLKQLQILRMLECWYFNPKNQEDVRCL